MTAQTSHEAETAAGVLRHLAELENAVDVHLHNAAKAGPAGLLAAASHLSAELTVLKERAGAIAAILARQHGLSWPAYISGTSGEDPVEVQPAAPEWARLAAPKLLRALVNASALADHAERETVTASDLWDGMLAVREGSAATIVSVLLGDESARAVARRVEEQCGGRPPVPMGGPAQVVGTAATVRPFSGPAKSLLELSAQLASSWGHGFVGTEHLMLAMLDADPALWPERTNLPITRDALAEELGQMLAAIGLEIPKTDSQKEPHHE